jgi:hypothetical protein
LKLNNVQHVPSFKQNLVSGPQFRRSIRQKDRSATIPRESKNYPNTSAMSSNNNYARLENTPRKLGGMSPRE